MVEFPLKKPFCNNVKVYHDILHRELLESSFSVQLCDSVPISKGDWVRFTSLLPQKRQAVSDVSEVRMSLICIKHLSVLNDIMSL